METQRLKLKIGEHEFEAEGPPEIIQSQFKAFQELVLKALAVAPSTAYTPPMPIPVNPSQKEQSPKQPAEAELPDTKLDKIMRVEGRIVSLTVHADSVDDAILLLIFGQKVFFNKDSVGGSEIMEGLRVSGHTVSRVDRNLEKIGHEGDLIVLGQGRAKRYRLTNRGQTRAREIAQDRLSIIP